MQHAESGFFPVENPRAPTFVRADWTRGGRGAVWRRCNVRCAVRVPRQRPTAALRPPLRLERSEQQRLAVARDASGAACQNKGAGSRAASATGNQRDVIERRPRSRDLVFIYLKKKTDLSTRRVY